MKEKVFTTRAKLLALLSDMSKHGKVYKDEFISEALDLLIDDYNDVNSARNAVLYHLSKLVENQSVKIETETNGSEYLILQKKYSTFTLAKVLPYTGIIINCLIAFLAFAFSLLWAIVSKEYSVLILSVIYLFSSIILLVSYERALIVKKRKS